MSSSPSDNAQSLVYVVHRMGVYEQNISGITFDRDLAIDVAKRACNEEDDNYHHFEIYPMKIEFDTLYDRGKLIGTVRKFSDIGELFLSQPRIEFNSFIFKAKEPH